MALFLRRITPFVLAFALIGGTIFFAISCKGSTVAFSNDGKVASLNVDVAGTRAERGKGLSGRKELAEDSGMLFKFDTDTDTAFWMKDTSIPLSIAFIDSSGTVLAIEDMEPFDSASVRPHGKYRYAIEVNRGWFEANGVTPGSKATIDI